jgi:hypothetical protein
MRVGTARVIVSSGLATHVDAALIYALFGAVALTLVVLAVGGMRR